MKKLPKILKTGLAGLALSLAVVLSLPAAQKPINPNTLDGEYDLTPTMAEFHGRRLTVSPLAFDTSPQPVLGTNSENKRIEVDLTNQRLYAYEGSHLVFDFLISSGKWGRTPTGTFQIWGKFRYTKMSGGNRALRTYYYLPNVPFVMYFSNDEIAASRGYGLHGTYWHDNFGHPMSHGCVNMRTEDAGKIYYWSQPSVGENKTIRASSDNPGTPIIIYGVAPRE